MSTPSPEPQPVTPVTPKPAPEPAPVAPTPAPSPVGPVLPPADLTSVGWWQWALTTLISMGVGIGVLVGHPFNSAIVTAVVPSVALIDASVATAIQLHGVHKVAVARLQHDSAIRTAQMYHSNLPF